MEVAGAQRVLLAQARWFYKQGYPVQVVFFYDKQGLESSWQAANPFPVLSLVGWKENTPVLFNIPKLAGALFTLFKLLRKDIKVILSFTPHSNLLGLPIAWLARVPARVGTHHGYILGASRLFSWLHGWLTNSRICSMLVAVSAPVGEHAIKMEKAKSSKVIVIQNGIEPLEQKPGDRELVRKQLGVRLDGLLLITVGRLTTQKGQDVLIEAISQISSLFPQARFAFVGDGPRRSALEEKAKRLGIDGQVLFLGVRDDVSSLLYASDIFIQPSLSEGLSLAFLEALFAGLPVVVTRVGGVADVVEHGQSALLVPAGDAEELAAALVRLLGDAALRQRLARAGQERAVANHGIEKMCRAYETLMQGLLNAS